MAAAVEFLIKYFHSDDDDDNTRSPFVDDALLPHNGGQVCQVTGNGFPDTPLHSQCLSDSVNYSQQYSYVLVLVVAARLIGI